MYGKGYLLEGRSNGMFNKKHKPESIQKMKDNRRDYSGKNNPMFGKVGKDAPCHGTKWIYNAELNKDMKVKEDELPKYLSIGWIRGRGPDFRKKLSDSCLGRIPWNKNRKGYKKCHRSGT